MKPDLVVLGNLALDDVVYSDGRTRMAQPGGSTLYVALAARLWGIGVGMVTVAGDDYPSEVLAALGERGIDLAGVRRLGRSGQRSWLLYEGRQRRVIHRLDGPSHAESSPTLGDIPEPWRQARALHLAPMPFESHRRLAAELATLPGVQVSLDPFALLSTQDIAAWRQLLAGVDVFFVSEDEMTVEGALRDPRPVLAELATERLRTVLFKRGVRGGTLYDVRGGNFREWTARADEVVDPTGAGDAFAGGVLAGRLLGESFARALERGVVSASFAIADTGADGLLAATPEEAEDRLRAWFGPRSGSMHAAPTATC